MSTSRRNVSATRGKVMRGVRRGPVHITIGSLEQSPFARKSRSALARVTKRSRKLIKAQLEIRDAQALLRTTQLELDAKLAVVSNLLASTLLEGSGSSAGTAQGGAHAVDGAWSRIQGDKQRIALVQLLADAEQPLEADELASSLGMIDLMPKKYQRLLARQLRERGYLSRGLTYARAAARAGTARDAEILALREGEVATLSGAFRPKVRSAPTLGAPGRILHVVGYSLQDKESGYTIRTQYTAKAQAAVGLDPHVVTQVGVSAEDLTHSEDVDGIPHHRVAGPGRATTDLSVWLQRNTEELLDVVQRVRPSLLHAHSDFLNALTAQAVGEATGLPVVYETRGFWEESWLSRTADAFGWPGLDPLDALAQRYGIPEAYSWRRDRETEARAAADHVVTLARVMAERILEAGLPENHLSLAPNAVQLDAFPLLERDLVLANEVGIADGAVVVGYISSLVEYEGIDTLVEAFAAVRNTATAPVHLLIVGDGTERPRLEALANALGREGISFTGRVPHEHINRYYSLIDVFVVPRRPSRVCQLVTPLKPFEAFATGRAVVLSDVEALREIAEDSGAARMFKAGSPAALAEVLNELVDAPEQRSTLAELGYQWVRSARTWEANAATYIDVYRRFGVEPAHG